MHPTLFTLFGIQITTYGALIALAFVTLWFCTVYRGKKLGYSEEFIQNLLTIIVISAFVFARVLHVIVDWEAYRYDLKLIFLSRDGYVFLGGFLGAVTCSVWYTRKNKQSILGVGDLFAPFLALAQGIGRIGCFLFGCCFGKVCESGLCVHFPEDSPAYIHQYNQGLIDSSQLQSLPVHPTQLYHSAFNFIHFGILLFLVSRQKFRGQIAMAYLIIYSIGRFAIEFFRGDSYRGFYGPFSTSQLISMLLFSCGLVGYLILRKKNLAPVTPQNTENTAA